MDSLWFGPPFSLCYNEVDSSHVTRRTPPLADFRWGCVYTGLSAYLYRSQIGSLLKRASQSYSTGLHGPDAPSFFLLSSHRFVSCHQAECQSSPPLRGGLF